MIGEILYGKRTDDFEDSSFSDDGIKKLCREIVVDSVKNLRLYGERYLNASTEEEKKFASFGIRLNKNCLRVIDEEWLIGCGFQHAGKIRRMLDRSIAMGPEEFLGMGKFKIKGLKVVLKGE